MYKIALAQIQSSEDKPKNLVTALSLIQEAKRRGAELIAFPEFLMAFSPVSQSAEQLTHMAERADGPFVSALAEAAKRSAIAVTATIYETSNTPNRVYDTAVWIDGNGSIVAAYRKLHLYDAFGFKESDKFCQGQSLASVVQSGEGRFGMMICYDLRFPELARLLALRGANVLIAPSGWVEGDLKLDHWRTMIKARALENGCYVVASDQVGNVYLGHSMVVDPLGRTLIDLEDRQALEVLELDFKLVRETREQLPLLKNRRPDVYARHNDPNPLSS
jgi:predicted amidohydrolase